MILGIPIRPKTINELIRDAIKYRTIQAHHASVG